MATTRANANSPARSKQGKDQKPASAQGFAKAVIQAGAQAAKKAPQNAPKPAAQAAPKPAAQAAPKPAPQNQPKPAQQAAPQSQPKPAQQAAPQNQPKPAPQAAPQNQPKPAAQDNAQPAAAPKPAAQVSSPAPAAPSFPSAGTTPPQVGATGLDRPAVGSAFGLGDRAGTRPEPGASPTTPPAPRSVAGIDLPQLDPARHLPKPQSAPAASANRPAQKAPETRDLSAPFPVPGTTAPQMGATGLKAPSVQDAFNMPAMPPAPNPAPKPAPNPAPVRIAQAPATGFPAPGTTQPQLGAVGQQAPASVSQTPAPIAAEFYGPAGAPGSVPRIPAEQAAPTGSAVATPPAPPKPKLLDTSVPFTSGPKVDGPVPGVPSFDVGATLLPGLAAPAAPKTPVISTAREAGGFGLGAQAAPSALTSGPTLTTEQRIDAAKDRQQRTLESFKAVNDPATSSREVVAKAIQTVNGVSDVGSDIARQSEGPAAFIGNTAQRLLTGKAPEASADGIAERGTAARKQLEAIQSQVGAGKITEDQAARQAREIVSGHMKATFGDRSGGQVGGQVKDATEANGASRGVDAALTNTVASLGATGTFFASGGNIPAAVSVGMAVREAGGAANEAGGRDQTRILKEAYGLNAKQGSGDNLTLLALDAATGNKAAQDTSRLGSATLGTVANAGLSALDAVGLKAGSVVAAKTSAGLAAAAPAATTSGALMRSAGSAYAGAVTSNAVVGAGSALIGTGSDVATNGLTADVGSRAATNLRNAGINAALSPFTALPSLIPGVGPAAGNFIGATGTGIASQSLINTLDGRGPGVSGQQVTIAALGGLSAATRAATITAMTPPVQSAAATPAPALALAGADADMPTQLALPPAGQTTGLQPVVPASAPPAQKLLPAVSSSKVARAPDGTPLPNGTFTVKVPGNPDAPEAYNVGYAFNAPTSKTFPNVNPKTGEVTGTRTLYEGPFMAMRPDLQKQAVQQIPVWNPDPDYTHSTPAGLTSTFNTSTKTFRLLTERPQGNAQGQGENLIGLGAMNNVTHHYPDGSVKPADYFTHFAANKSAGGAGQQIWNAAYKSATDRGRDVSFISVDPSNSQPKAFYGAGGPVEPNLQAVYKLDPNVRLIPEGRFAKAPDGGNSFVPLPRNIAGWSGPDHDWNGVQLTGRDGKPLNLDLPFGSTVVMGKLADPANPPSYIGRPDGSTVGLGSLTRPVVTPGDAASQPVFNFSSNRYSLSGDALAAAKTGNNLAPAPQLNPLQQARQMVDKTVAFPSTANAYLKGKFVDARNKYVLGPVGKQVNELPGSMMGGEIAKTGTMFGPAVKFDDISLLTGNRLTKANGNGIAPDPTAMGPAQPAAASIFAGQARPAPGLATDVAPGSAFNALDPRSQAAVLTGGEGTIVSTQNMIGQPASIPAPVVARADMIGKGLTGQAGHAIDQWYRDPANAPLANTAAMAGEMGALALNKTVVPVVKHGVIPAWKHAIFPALKASPFVAQGLISTGHVESGSFKIPATDEGEQKLPLLQRDINARANWIPAETKPDGTPGEGANLNYWAVKVPGVPGAIAAHYYIDRNVERNRNIFKGNWWNEPGKGGAPSWIDFVPAAASAAVSGNASELAKLPKGQVDYLFHNLMVDASTVRGWTFGTPRNHTNTMAIIMENRRALPFGNIVAGPDGKGGSPLSFTMGVNGGNVALLSHELAFGDRKVSVGQGLAAPWLKAGIGTNGLNVGLNFISPLNYLSFSSNPAAGTRVLSKEQQQLSGKEIEKLYFPNQTRPN